MVETRKKSEKALDLREDNKRLTGEIENLKSEMSTMSEVLDMVTAHLAYLEGADEETPGKWIRENDKLVFKLTEELKEEG